MAEETMSVCAVQELTGLKLLLGLSFRKFYMKFSQKKKPKATVNVCSGLADAAWCSKGHDVGGS